jgi:hypothetical protein
MTSHGIVRANISERTRLYERSQFSTTNATLARSLVFPAWVPHPEARWFRGDKRSLLEIVAVPHEDILANGGLATSGDAHETNNPLMRLPANDG